MGTWSSWQLAKGQCGGLSLSCGDCGGCGGLWGAGSTARGPLQFPQGPSTQQAQSLARAPPGPLCRAGAGEAVARGRGHPRERMQGSGRLKGDAGAGESLHPGSSPVTLGVSLCPQLCPHLLSPDPGLLLGCASGHHPLAEPSPAGRWATDRTTEPWAVLRGMPRPGPAPDQASCHWRTRGHLHRLLTH